MQIKVKLHADQSQPCSIAVAATLLHVAAALRHGKTIANTSAGATAHTEASTHSEHTGVRFHPDSGQVRAGEVDPQHGTPHLITPIVPWWTV